MTCIFIAGASAELERCERFRDECKRLGYTLAIDWMATVRRVGAANEGVDDDVAIRASEKNLDAVGQADCFVLLVPSAPTVGAWVEFGAWLACFDGDALIVGRHPSIYLRGLATVDNDEEALMHLRALIEGLPS